MKEDALFERIRELEKENNIKLTEEEEKLYVVFRPFNSCSDIKLITKLLKFWRE